MIELFDIFFQDECASIWGGYGEAREDLQLWAQDDNDGALAGT